MNTKKGLYTKEELKLDNEMKRIYKVLKILMKYVKRWGNKYQFI